MNKIILIGRLVRDVDTKYTQGANTTAVSRYTLAVNRRFKREGEADADFINCVAFGRAAEFADKYFKKGMRVAVSGRLQTGSYKKQDGTTVYTTDVVIEEQDFCESKNTQASAPAASNDGFMNIANGVDEELPFF